MHPTITKILHCAGSPYDIGFAHGSGAADEIHSNIVMYTEFFNFMANITWQEARERASTFLPVLNARYPAILEEMKGIADGAGKKLDMTDILTLNARSELGLTNVADGCTSLAQRGPRGQIFLAQNWDWIETSLVVLHIAPHGSHLEMKFMSEAGLVGKIGLNSAGVGTLLNGIRAGAQSKDKFPIHIMLRRILQFASSFADAFAIIEKHGLASSANIVIADKTGDGGSIECSPHGNTIIPLRKDKGQFVAHTNHLYAPDRPSQAKDFPEEGSFARLARMEELTIRDDRNGIPPTFQNIRARLSDQQGGELSICVPKPTDKDLGIDRVTTVGSILMELSSKTVQLTVGRPCDDLSIIEWQI